MPIYNPYADDPESEPMVHFQVEINPSGDFFDVTWHNLSTGEIISAGSTFTHDQALDVAHILHTITWMFID